MLPVHTRFSLSWPRLPECSARTPGSKHECYYCNHSTASLKPRSSRRQRMSNPGASPKRCSRRKGHQSGWAGNHQFSGLRSSERKPRLCHPTTRALRPPQHGRNCGDWQSLCWEIWRIKCESLSWITAWSVYRINWIMVGAYSPSIEDKRDIFTCSIPTSNEWDIQV